MHDGANVLGAEGGLPLQRTEQPQDRGHLDDELQCGADDGTDGEGNGEARLSGGGSGDAVAEEAAALPHQRRDHGQVPDDRRGVGEEEAAVAVENAETPR